MASSTCSPPRWETETPSWLCMYMWMHTICTPYAESLSQGQWLSAINLTSWSSNANNITDLQQSQTNCSSPIPPWAPLLGLTEYPENNERSYGNGSVLSGPSSFTGAPWHSYINVILKKSSCFCMHRIYSVSVITTNMFSHNSLIMSLFMWCKFTTVLTLLTVKA